MNKLAALLPLLLTFGCTSVVVLGFEDGGTSTGGLCMTNGAASSTGAGTTSGTSTGQNTATGTTGGTSAGSATGSATGNTTGGSSTGTTGADPCSLIHCAPSFACDQTDGTCECAGQDCAGNCDADSGACLAACPGQGFDGGTFPVIGQSPYAVQMTTAILNHTYVYTLQPACGAPPWSWMLLSSATSLEDIGLLFYPDQGEIAGVPTVTSGAVPFEFEIEATDSLGNTGVQNYLLYVVASPSP